MENSGKTVAVPMIGIISRLEELDFAGVRREVHKANTRISTHTMIGVLEVVLEGVYYDPIQAMREQRLQEACYPFLESKVRLLTLRLLIQIEAIKASIKRTRRSAKAKPTSTSQGSGEPRERS